MQRFAVIGLGRFGQQLARALTAAEAEVIAIDRDAKLVEALRDEVTLAVRLDSTDAEALRAQGVDEVDVAVVGIGMDFESAALTVATLKQLGVGRIIARGERDVQARILTSVGADAIAAPERESALRWANRLTLPNLKQYLELGPGHAMVYATAPAAWHHKTLADLQLRNEYGVNLVAVQRRVTVAKGTGGTGSPAPVIVLPLAETTIIPGDVLILVGSDEALSQLPLG